MYRAVAVESSIDCCNPKCLLWTCSLKLDEELGIELASLLAFCSVRNIFCISKCRHKQQPDLDMSKIYYDIFEKKENFFSVKKVVKIVKRCCNLFLSEQIQELDFNACIIPKRHVLIKISCISFLMPYEDKVI